MKTFKKIGMAMLAMFVLAGCGSNKKATNPSYSQSQHADETDIAIPCYDESRSTPDFYRELGIGTEANPQSARDQAVKSAKATFVSRANPENKKVIELKRNGFCFEGEFKIPQDCYYDIIIRLDWDTVYREDTLEIRSMNKPPQLVGDITEVKVNKGKTITVSDIYQYVADEENDKILFDDFEYDMNDGYADTDED